MREPRRSHTRLALAADNGGAASVETGQRVRLSAGRAIDIDIDSRRGRVRPSRVTTSEKAQQFSRALVGKSICRRAISCCAQGTIESRLWASRRTCYSQRRALVRTSTVVCNVPESRARSDSSDSDSDSLIHSS